MIQRKLSLKTVALMATALSSVLMNVTFSQGFEGSYRFPRQVL
ncbi:hypothetical protein [Lentiprolixibacter aurantiacus]|uniref:Uncharacterized protein n=1 Tax=Lentiprolixibacter aurantiacus TaxID=2993939 RepID=A0AAE3MIZ0_9FLAO|nr:hypothetical protein [Lentiprolixibacter aurantiacus]MCX2718436.1 hypothetical protein [Lentiprolixibacter aurantiacus]